MLPEMTLSTGLIDGLATCRPTIGQGARSPGPGASAAGGRLQRSASVLEEVHGFGPPLAPYNSEMEACMPGGWSMGRKGWGADARGSECRPSPWAEYGLDTPLGQPLHNDN